MQDDSWQQKAILEKKKKKKKRRSPWLFHTEHIYLDEMSSWNSFKLLLAFGAVKQVLA